MELVVFRSEVKLKLPAARRRQVRALCGLWGETRSNTICLTIMQKIDILDNWKQKLMAIVPSIPQFPLHAKDVNYQGNMHLLISSLLPKTSYSFWLIQLSLPLGLSLPKTLPPFQAKT